MSRRITTLGFDADDTLWHNERFFRMTQARFQALLADHADPDHLAERLDAAERRNLGRYGYGIKGFVLSMIETALEITANRVPGSVLRQLIDAGHEMLAHPVELLPHVAETLTALAPDYTLVVVTKGDLLHQEQKLAQSGLGDLFDGVEIVSDKTPATYQQAFRRHGDGPERALMAGNSMRSDVLPALAAGAWGVHVPTELDWHHEAAPEPAGHARYRRIPDLSALRPLLADLD